MDCVLHGLFLIYVGVEKAVHGRMEVCLSANCSASSAEGVIKWDWAASVRFGVPW